MLLVTIISLNALTYVSKHRHKTKARRVDKGGEKEWERNREGIQ